MDERTPPTRVEVVIVPRDRFSMFPRCLEALYANTEIPFRVIVVAGGADARTAAYLRRFESQMDNATVVLRIRLLLQGEARNVGLRHVSGRYCVILENDTIVHQNWLAPLLDCMEEEDAAVVMPLIYWYGRVHAAGCSFSERDEDGVVTLHHEILYTGIAAAADRLSRVPLRPRRSTALPGRGHLRGCGALRCRPRAHGPEAWSHRLRRTACDRHLRCASRLGGLGHSAVQVPLGSGDVEIRNRMFMRKWGLAYHPSPKLASYRRQQWRLGLARWHPNRFTVGPPTSASR